GFGDLAGRDIDENSGEVPRAAVVVAHGVAAANEPTHMIPGANDAKLARHRQAKSNRRANAFVEYLAVLGMYRLAEPLPGKWRARRDSEHRTTMIGRPQQTGIRLEPPYSDIARGGRESHAVFALFEQ